MYVIKSTRFLTSLPYEWHWTSFCWHTFPFSTWILIDWCEEIIGNVVWEVQKVYSYDIAPGQIDHVQSKHLAPMIQHIGPILHIRMKCPYVRRKSLHTYIAGNKENTPWKTDEPNEIHSISVLKSFWLKFEFVEQMS